MNKNVWAQLTNINPQSMVLEPEQQLANDMGIALPQAPSVQQLANQPPIGSQMPQVERSLGPVPSYSRQFDDAFKGTMDERKLMLAKLQEKMAMEEKNKPQGADVLNLRPFLTFADQLSGSKAAAAYEPSTAPQEHKAKLAKLQEQINAGSDKLSDDQLGYLKLKAMEEMSRNRLDASGAKGDANEEHKIRAQYLSNPVIKDFNDVDSAFKTIETNPGLNGPDQEAFVVQFNKLLDPGSVVREGEFFRSASNAGKINQMQQLVEKWRTGKGLTPEQVRDMKTVARQIQQSYRNKVNAINKDFEYIANRKGLDSRSIVLDSYRDTKPPVKSVSFEEWKKSKGTR